MITIVVTQGELNTHGKNVAFEQAFQSLDSSLWLTTFAPSRGVGLKLNTFAPEALTVNTKVLPSNDALMFTKYPPGTFRQDYVLPGIDTLAFAGKTPVITLNHIATPAAETLALAGQALAVSTPDARVTLPGRRALTLFREAPLLIIGSNTVIGPPKGAVTFASAANTALRTQNIWKTPARKALSFTRYAPSCIRGTYRYPGSKALTFSMKSVSVQPSSLVIVPAGALTFDTKPAASAPSQLVLQLSGQTPTISIQYTVQVPIADNPAEQFTTSLVLLTGGVLIETAGYKSINNVEVHLVGAIPTISFSSFLGQGGRDIISLSVEREIVIIHAPTVVG